MIKPKQYGHKHWFSGKQLTEPAGECVSSQTGCACFPDKIPGDTEYHVISARCISGRIRRDCGSVFDDIISMDIFSGQVSATYGAKGVRGEAGTVVHDLFVRPGFPVHLILFEN